MFVQYTLKVKKLIFRCNNSKLIMSNKNAKPHKVGRVEHGCGKLFSRYNEACTNCTLTGEKMKTLLLLYFLYLELGGVGGGKVTILALSRYMRMSKTAMRDMLIAVDKLGYINVYEEFGKGNYKTYKVALNTAGQEFLDDNWDAVQVEYRRHVAETIAIIKERNSDKYPSDKKMLKKLQAQLLAGQKELF
jgi:hypothetical protein